MENKELDNDIKNFKESIINNRIVDKPFKNTHLYTQYITLFSALNELNGLDNKSRSEIVDFMFADTNEIPSCFNNIDDVFPGICILALTVSLFRSYFIKELGLNEKLILPTHHDLISNTLEVYKHEGYFEKYNNNFMALQGIMTDLFSRFYDYDGSLSVLFEKAQIPIYFNHQGRSFLSYCMSIMNRNIECIENREILKRSINLLFKIIANDQSLLLKFETAQESKILPFKKHYENAKRREFENYSAFIDYVNIPLVDDRVISPTILTSVFKLLFNNYNYANYDLFHDFAIQFLQGFKEYLKVTEKSLAEIRYFLDFPVHEGKFSIHLFNIYKVINPSSDLNLTTFTKHVKDIKFYDKYFKNILPEELYVFIRDNYIGKTNPLFLITVGELMDFLGFSKDGLPLSPHTTNEYISLIRLVNPDCFSLPPFHKIVTLPDIDSLVALPDDRKREDFYYIIGSMNLSDISKLPKGLKIAVNSFSFDNKVIENDDLIMVQADTTKNLNLCKTLSSFVNGDFILKNDSEKLNLLKYTLGNVKYACSVFGKFNVFNNFKKANPQPDFNDSTMDMYNLFSSGNNFLKDLKVLFDSIIDEKYRSVAKEQFDEINKMISSFKPHVDKYFALAFEAKRISASKAVFMDNAAHTNLSSTSPEDSMFDEINRKMPISKDQSSEAKHVDLLTTSDSPAKSVAKTVNDDFVGFNQDETHSGLSKEAAPTQPVDTSTKPNTPKADKFKKHDDSFVADVDNKTSQTFDLGDH